MHEHLTSWLVSQTWPDLEDRITSDTSRVVYRHPYGFVVVRLPETNFLGWQIRVHLWPERSEGLNFRAANGTDSQEIHAHGWEIISRVVLGELEEKTFALGPGAGRLFSVASDHGVGVSALNVLTDDVHATCVETTVRSEADGLFQIDAGRFHSTQSAARPSASVVATSTAKGAGSLVWSPSGTPPRTNARLEVEDVDQLLSSYARQYSATHPTTDRWASFVFLLNAQDQVLLVRPARHPNIWQPVGGRSDSRDRDEVDTVIREVIEEAGLVLKVEQLTFLKKGPRDVGRGIVHFWASRVGNPQLSMQYGEILEARWFDLSDALKLEMYPATQSALNALVREEGTRDSGNTAR